MTDRTDLQVGDETIVVITKPHADIDKDPMTQIDGTATFVRFNDEYTPDFGESARIRIADISHSSIVAVAVDTDPDS